MLFIPMSLKTNLRTFSFFFLSFFFFGLCHVACGISVPQPGIEPGPLGHGSESLES